MGAAKGGRVGVLAEEGLRLHACHCLGKNDKRDVEGKAARSARLLPLLDHSFTTECQLVAVRLRFFIFKKG